MLDSHPADLVKTLDTLLMGEVAHQLDQFGALDVLAGREVIRNQGHPTGIEDLAAVLPEFLNGRRGGQIVGKAEIDIDQDELPGTKAFLAAPGGQNLFR
ncbi:MAG: hypothetical protein BWY73_01233 [candidate division TA06 bacterium ADurb.Bin417]|uniref:Uncharacterized protein n=1 Tax=candidate division TA06 bacterium ADurb.Bin417 TaxID=1852828 RepID=A0A1V5MDE7_UNCT6|nr:MAG: hypothetical protein BWY73_01233 [candidate division TA06 bacterium ADurb.Bin417]